MAAENKITNALAIFSPSGVSLTRDQMWEALQAPGSGVSINGRVLPEGNKRLAAVGCVVVQLCITESSYRESLFTRSYQDIIRLLL